MKKKIILSIGILCCLIALLILAEVNLDSYLKRTLNVFAIYTILALSMNLVNGFTGLFSLGQAGFMAIGAYTVAIFTVPIEQRSMVFYLEPMHPALANVEMPFVVALLLGGAVASFVAFLIGAPTLRLRGDYLAIATLGFSEIIRIVFTNTQSITNGALGIKNIPMYTNLYWSFGIASLMIIGLWLLIKSSYGRAFKAIREDEIAAAAMGVGLFKHKILAFMISAFMAGVGGGLFAALLGTVDPKQFYFVLTYNFLMIIVLGGLGSISGTVLAAFLVTIGLEWLRFLDEPLTIGSMTIPLFRPGLRMVVFSLLLMCIVLFYRKGLMGQEEMSKAWFIKQKNKVIKWMSIVKGKQGGESL